jgi:hypothetical protein
MLAIFGLCAAFIMALAMPASDPCSCLPKDIKRSDVVSVALSKPGRAASGKITVEQKLKELKARCRKGKLVDVSGKQIYFYRLQGCWGNPPEGYQEILSQQARELEKLRRRYRVIEMTCNPDGVQPF